jgi:HEPN domain-containing protein
MPTSDQIRVASFLATADNDIGMAQILLQNGPQYYEGIGFHCQQAVEKYLKAALVASGLPTPLIHNLVLLLAPLQQVGALQLTTQDLADAAALNEFAVEFRYELDDAPSFTSADLVAMADRFRTKLRPLAQAFLI